MKFTEENRDLLNKLYPIWIDCVFKMKSTGDTTYCQEEYFLDQVFNAHLVEGEKEIFLLGALAQSFHDFAPQATIQMIDELQGKKSV